MAEVTNDEANDLADEILLRSEFLPAREPGLLERTINRVMEAIGNFLEPIFSAIFGGAGGAAGTAVAYILLALAAAVLVYAVVKAIRGRVPKPDEDDTPGARIVFDEVVEPSELRAQLARHRAAGDWRSAVVAGFRLSVSELIDAGIARPVAGATTGDFGVAVQRRRPELSADYAQAARSFERAFYSDLEVSAADMEHVDTFLNRLTAVASR